MSKKSKVYISVLALVLGVSWVQAAPASNRGKTASRGPASTQVASKELSKPFSLDPAWNRDRKTWRLLQEETQRKLPYGVFSRTAQPASKWNTFLNESTSVVGPEAPVAARF